jgi:hypothetical protein
VPHYLLQVDGIFSQLCYEQSLAFAISRSLESVLLLNKATNILVQRDVPFQKVTNQDAFLVHIVHTQDTYLGKFLIETLLFSKQISHRLHRKTPDLPAPSAASVALLGANFMTSY